MSNGETDKGWVAASPFLSHHDVVNTLLTPTGSELGVFTGTCLRVLVSKPWRDSRPASSTPWWPRTWLLAAWISAAWSSWSCWTPRRIGRHTFTAADGRDEPGKWAPGNYPWGLSCVLAGSTLQFVGTVVCYDEVQFDHCVLTSLPASC